MDFLISNNGPHPADNWAALATTRILDLIQIDPNSTSPQAIEARLAKEDIRPKLLRYLNDHFNLVQSDERTMVRHMHEPIEVEGPITTILANVGSIAKGTPFAAHFKNPDFRETVRRIVGQFTANVMHIERRYHADRKQKAT